MKTLLFQGDSITDCGRDREGDKHIGRGYVNLLTTRIAFEQVANPWTIYNKGISGNRTNDLLGRWKEDCLDLQPDILSLYIGINNTWRKYDRDDPTPVDVFEAELHALLKDVWDKTPCDPAASILIEPYVLDIPAGRQADWSEDLVPKQTVVREAAATYGMRHLPLQQIFDDAVKTAPPERWAHDGVHPSYAGHYLIATSWYDVMQDVVAP